MATDPQPISLPHLKAQIADRLDVPEHLLIVFLTEEGGWDAKLRVRDFILSARLEAIVEELRLRVQVT